MNRYSWVKFNRIVGDAIGIIMIFGLGYAALIIF